MKSLILRSSLYLTFSLLWSCGLFTFSGVALSPDVKTFSIQTFHTEVSDGPIDMPSNLTEALKEKLSRSTPLTREEKDGDIQYEGIIKSFSYRTTFSTKSDNNDTPKEVQRLTITIEVSFINRFDEEASFKKKQFSASEDILYTENQLEKEPELVKKIFTKLVDEIYNKSLDNW
ncbi:MAG: LPS assembly lipoprotein LptE [Candidatus Cardinium sp.]|uniref:LPS assembly lipoprotein LptE n=1 Tax=Cardinium endosymbiont of Dermatophagoides farinae TaxID=2597823 RepID=UPI0016435994|nr:LptE family protein [Cardinium endosymbiont of Dermatophagoides farinae]UWW96791.1 MAG: LPS assembly lipoprotein LptE [Candidatus Cardinium sp.]